MTCACPVTYADECLRVLAPWTDSDDVRVRCMCSCHEFIAIDLASESLDEEGNDGAGLSV